MTNVMLVDDHASFREALAFLIDREADITVVAQAGSIAQARQVLGTADIDVCMLDMQLPDGEGIELLPDLYRRCPGASAIVLTGTELPHNRARSIASGAVGFIHKAATVPEILGFIRQAAAGKPLISSHEAMTLLREASQYQAQVQGVRRALDRLTPREMDVLKALARGLDNQAIADQLLVTNATVRSHVVHLLQKLGVESRLQAALIAVQYGIGNPNAR